MTADGLPGARGFLRRRKRSIIVVTVVMAIAFVPMFPYNPRCYERYEPTSVGGVILAQDYKKGLTAHLKLYHVPYMSVGNVVLLRFWTWFTDPDSWVANASNKTVRALSEGRYYAAEKPVPPRVREMVEKAREADGSIEAECPLVHAVAIEGW